MMIPKGELEHIIKVTLDTIPRPWSVSDFNFYGKDNDN